MIRSHGFRASPMTCRERAPMSVSSLHGYNAAGQIASRGSFERRLFVRGLCRGDHLYAVNGLNQYSAVGSGALVYDATMAILKQWRRKLYHDVENRLVAATRDMTTSIVCLHPWSRLFPSRRTPPHRSNFFTTGTESEFSFSAAGRLHWSLNFSVRQTEQSSHLVRGNRTPQSYSLQTDHQVLSCRSPTAWDH